MDREVRRGGGRGGHWYLREEGRGEKGGEERLWGGEEGRMEEIVREERREEGASVSPGKRERVLEMWWKSVSWPGLWKEWRTVRGV